jgi:hypothetical protein
MKNRTVRFCLCFCLAAGSAALALPQSSSAAAESAQPSVTGSGGADYIPKFSTATKVTNSVIYQSGADIGIGTTSPAAKLEVNGGAQVDGNLALSGSILWSTGSAPLIQFSTNGQEDFSAGIGAGFNTNSSQNTIIGYEALKAVTTGSQNTAVGDLPLKADTIGFDNTALGFNAMLANTTGPGNTAVGQQTLLNLTSGKAT